MKMGKNYVGEEIGAGLGRVIDTASPPSLLDN
jgi:hypothetical protein